MTILKLILYHSNAMNNTRRSNAQYCVYNIILNTYLYNYVGTKYYDLGKYNIL